MSKSNKFSPEVRERAVRMVQEHRGEYASLWTAVEAVTPRSRLAHVADAERWRVTRLEVLSAPVCR